MRGLPAYRPTSSATQPDTLSHCREEVGAVSEKGPADAEAARVATVLCVIPSPALVVLGHQGLLDRTWLADLLYLFFASSPKLPRKCPKAKPLHKKAWYELDCLAEALSYDAPAPRVLHCCAGGSLASLRDGCRPVTDLVGEDAGTAEMIQP